jgi:hypothetical protein
MIEEILLKNISYDIRARNGTWCSSPYPGHKRGCPNIKKGCLRKTPDFAEFPARNWYAVIEEFDLAAHAKKMKEAHPDWSERQCRNPLYWQGGVRKRLRDKAAACAIVHNGDYILEIPEACGVDVFATMAKVGIVLERVPQKVIKVMLVGTPLG